MLLIVIYLMFFLSGAAALMYQVIWVRMLGLIFGGTNLAVTAVLSIFMAGLALGGYAIGRYADKTAKHLRLYGLLEFGIGISAILFVFFIKAYPLTYIFLASGKDDSPVYLFSIRILFSLAALIVPTTLMGGTLPVLTKFVSRREKDVGSQLSFLYAFNTIGAVAGALIAGFYLLRFYSVTVTVSAAVAINLLIGIISILIQDKTARVFAVDKSAEESKGSFPDNVTDEKTSEYNGSLFPVRLVVLGIGISGFCALGYEVLWTRVLTIVVGASVYGFTIMLVAFLAGIAIGSELYGIIPKIFRLKDRGIGSSIFWFGIVQIIIGITALIVSIYIRDLPVNSMRLQNYFQNAGEEFFQAKIWSNFALAFIYMFVPALFMGISFPLAGKVHAEYKKKVGSAVGELLAYNTVGAILGAAVSGFVMIYLFGIERSLQILIVINLGLGLLVVLSLLNIKLLNWFVPVLTIGSLLFLFFNHDALRIWNTKYFAIFRNNQPEAFNTPEKIEEAMENTDVLYYAEGVEAIISSVKVKGGHQSFITNGRVEASTSMEGQQCQIFLGHLPMLLNKNPRKVLVIGTGSGMTLGATSVYPSVEEITLVEIEPEVIGATRTFGAYNHHVIDNPKLRMIFNDGRNFLLTTKEKFDVITADPIHPWFRGAGYLYATEYFKLASEHLTPGGIICQWLPLYELTVDNVKSVVKTFSENFKYSMIWLSYNDAEIIGSNSPIMIDESELSVRVSQPEVLNDLKRVLVQSSDDLLSFFLMGRKGMEEFSRDGIANTNDNLYLEFSAPFSIGKGFLTGINVNALAKYRESILPYLVPAEGREAQEEQKKKWESYDRASDIAVKAQGLFLGGKSGSRDFEIFMNVLEDKYKWHALGRMLRSEITLKRLLEPKLLKQTGIELADLSGRRILIELSVVLVPVSKERAAVAFVDNEARKIYGQIYINDLSDETINPLVDDIMTGIDNVYNKEFESAVRVGKTLPPYGSTIKKIEKEINSRIDSIIN